MPAPADPRRPGLVVHRMRLLAARHVARRCGIPVATPIVSLVDIAPALGPARLEAAVNEADRRDLVDPESLRAGLEELRGWPGVAPLRELLDRRTFALTDSELERRFLPLARSAGSRRPKRRHG